MYNLKQIPLYFSKRKCYRSNPTMQGWQR